MTILPWVSSSLDCRSYWFSATASRFVERPSLEGDELLLCSYCRVIFIVVPRPWIQLFRFDSIRLILLPFFVVSQYFSVVSIPHGSLSRRDYELQKPCVYRFVAPTVSTVYVSEVVIGSPNQFDFQRRPAKHTFPIAVSKSSFLWWREQSNIVINQSFDQDWFITWLSVPNAVCCARVCIAS